MKVGNLEVYGVIYKIKNKINKKVYIGQTVSGFNKRYRRSGADIERVYNCYLYNKNNSRNYNEHLFKSIEKNGYESFEVIKIFDIAFSKEELDIKEQIWIDYFNSTDKKYGYNNQTGGSKGIPSKKTKEKMSINSGVAKKIICLNTLKVFNNIIQGARYYNVDRSSVLRCCRNRQKFAGKYNEQPLVWSYFDDYINYKKRDIIKKLEDARNWEKILFNQGTTNLIARRRKVICITTNKIFESISKASKYYNITNGTFNISACCNKKQLSCGKLIDGTPLKWMYYEEYLKLDSNEVNQKIKETYNNREPRKIICINTKEQFSSIKEASKIYDCDNSNISKCCQGKQKTAGKLKDGTKLKWMYYSDYLKEVM